MSSLISELKDISSRSNDTKYPFYETLATKVVETNQVEQIGTIVKHRTEKKHMTTHTHAHARATHT